MIWLPGLHQPVDTHPSVVRSTLDKADSTEAAELPGPNGPQWNQFDSDKDPALVGLSPRQLGPDVHAGVQYAPFWSGLASNDYEARIDDQVSSSGTAAAREVAGQFGHGTAEYSESIEPVIREGAAYGSDYFVRTPALIQGPAGSYLGSPVPDVDWQGVSQAVYVQNSRAAYTGLYDNLIGG